MRLVRPASAFSALVVTTSAGAQPVLIADSGDSAWVLGASLIALLALLAGIGTDRSRRPVLLLIVAGASLVWALGGYSLTFGDGSSLLGGISNLGLTGLADLRDGTTVSEPVYALFEMAFAIAAVALLFPQFATIRIAWSAAFAPLWLLLVYVPVARWMWGGGWLSETFALDFAGGLVLHATAGVSALVVAILARKRADDHDMAFSNVAFVWAGLLALTGASALGAGADAASAIIDAQMAASAGALVWAVLDRKNWAQGLGCGAIAGLAASACGAGLLGAYGGALTGICGAFAAWVAARATRRWFARDQENAFAIHGVAGITGALTLPLFSLPLFGAGLDGGQTLAMQFVAQAIATAAVVLWAGGVTMVVALMITMIVPMQGATEARD